MGQNTSKRTVGVRKVQPHNIGHVRIFYDDKVYAGHPNRGGIWNFGDGEIAAAHLVKRVNYQTGEGIKYPAYHDYATKPQSGVMINRSFDNGQTWPQSERKWIWNNERSLEDILDWLRPVDLKQREQFDLSDADTIIHFSPGEYLKFPFGGQGVVRFHLGQRPNPSFCLRSRDRGRTWENHATVIEGPPWGSGFLTVNLGYVRFDNGVLGIVGATLMEQHKQVCSCFNVSHDNALTWEYVSTIVAAEPSSAAGFDGARYTYMGVHILPDGRLLCSMHKIPGNYPCVAFSDDDGMTWSPPRFIVSPATCPPPFGPEPRRAPGTGDPRGPDGYDRGEIPRYRSPHALVTRDGRIIIVFARRYPTTGSRGISGVVSLDLGQTWSEEFILRGDAFCWDCGYPVITELEDGRFFTAYYITVDEGEQPLPASAAVRHIAGTFFELD